MYGMKPTMYPHVPPQAPRQPARNNMQRRSAPPPIERFEPRVLFAIFVVTTTADAGPGSFRAAITAANNNPNPPDDNDYIFFDIPGTGIDTITPLSPLPVITDAVIIDATDPANLITPNVELDGSLAGAGADGLVIASSDDVLASFVTGFIINSFSGNGVRITGDSNGLGLNLIGTDPSGTLAGPGNGGHGILIEGSNNFLSDNVIAFNAGDGIAVVGATATRNDAAINNFFSNGGLAIDLGNDGVTPNDPLDPDSGPNTLQNFPVLNKPTFVAGAGVTVTGSLNSTPNTNFDIVFYTSPNGDGEGSFRDHMTVHTDASGNATFTITLSGVAETDFVTATATGLVVLPTGDAFAVNTSEFSAPVTAAVTAPPDDANNGLGNNPGHTDPGNPGRGHRRRVELVELIQE